MEVLVVVAIIVVLAGLGVVVFRQLQSSQEKLAYAQVRKLQDVVEAFKLEQGDYPPSLEVLSEPIDGKPAYVEQAQLIDPWGRPYQYDPGQRNPRTGRPLIMSQGANPGSSAPIRNWQ